MSKFKLAALVIALVLVIAFLFVASGCNGMYPCKCLIQGQADDVCTGSEAGG